mgnify:CR=1 FL=1
MSAPIHIRIGDRAPIVTRSIGRSDGTSEALPSGTTVVLRVFDDEDAATDYTCTIVSATDGTVQYAWADDEPVSASREIDEPVQFSYVFVITFTDGRVVTSPTIGRDILVIHPRLRE